MKMVDAEGNVVASYEYDPYGKVISASGTMAHANPLRYRGYYYDSELEMYYLQSRYYDPNTGRFINADDISMVGASGTALGYNLFSYCLNNPVNTVDYFGTLGSPVQWACALLGLVFGIAFGDSIARSMGLAPSGKGIWNATKYYAVRAAVTVGTAALGYLVGTGIIKCVSIYIKGNPTATITLVKKLGADTAAKIMNAFGLNFMKYMKKGTLISFIANWFNEPTKKMSLEFTKLLIDACDALGIGYEFHSGHNKTKWNIPHLHIGNHKGHLALSGTAVSWIKRLLGIE